MNSHPKQLFRSRINRKIAGVCGGIGTYFNIDPTIVRLLYVMLTIVSVGIGLIAYIVMWLIVPEEQEVDHNGRTVDHDEKSNKS
jgi:phage shock protein C